MSIWNTDILGTNWQGSGPTSLGGRLFGTPSQLTSVSPLNPQQQQSLSSLLTKLSDPNAVQAYGGQLTAPTNTVQGLSLSALEQQAMNQVNASQPGGDQGIASQAYKDILSQGPQDLTSYFQSALMNPAMQMFEQQMTPALESQFRGLSGYGSDRQLATGRAAANVMTGVTGQMADATRQALSEQQRNKLAAASGLTNVGTQAIQNALALQQGGNIAQQTAQQPLSAAYGEFQRQQDAQHRNIQELLAALGISTTTPVVQPGTSGLLGGAAGGAIGGAIGKLL